MPLRNRINQLGSLYSQVCLAQLGPFGGTNNIGGATPVTANSTTDYTIATAPARLQVITAAVGYVGTQIASSGTILVSLWKRRGATLTQLTVTVNLVALAPNSGTTLAPLASNSEAANAIEVGDILFARFVSNNATISQQPSGLTIGAQLAALS